MLERYGFRACAFRTLWIKHKFIVNSKVLDVMWGIVYTESTTAQEGLLCDLIN